MGVAGWVSRIVAAAVSNGDMGMATHDALVGRSERLQLTRVPTRSSRPNRSATLRSRSERIWNASSNDAKSPLIDRINERPFGSGGDYDVAECKATDIC